MPVEAAWGCELDPSPGKAITEMIPTMLEHKIKAMYLRGENPRLSDADARQEDQQYR